MCVSVVVGVDAELDAWRSVDDDMVACEDRTVSQSRALLPAGSRGEVQHKVDELDDLLRPFGLETQLVVLSRANSIALFFVCVTLSAVSSLRDHWRSQQLRRIVESVFTYLAGCTWSDGSTRQVHVRRLVWPRAHYERCLEFFSSLQGRQTVWLLVHQSTRRHCRETISLFSPFMKSVLRDWFSR